MAIEIVSTGDLRFDRLSRGQNARFPESKVQNRRICRSWREATPTVFATLVINDLFMYSPQIHSSGNSVRDSSVLIARLRHATPRSVLHPEFPRWHR